MKSQFATPLTIYKPDDPGLYRDTDFRLKDGTLTRDHYRFAWRKMVDNSGTRTLIGAIIPPGGGLGDSLLAGVGSLEAIVDVSGSASTLLVDSLIRSLAKNNVLPDTLASLPIFDMPQFADEFRIRVLRLNCVTQAYGDLWSACWTREYARASWTLTSTVPIPNLALGEASWHPNVPLRQDLARYLAQVEIDVLMAVSLGVGPDELCAIYRTQFSSLCERDTRELYDANGRIVPNPVQVAYRKKGDRITIEELTHTNQAGNTYVYELPFAPRDREIDMRAAYRAFAGRLGGEGI